MAQTLRIITCPLCKGLGYHEPSAQKQDPPCPYCADAGFVADDTCHCGRPICWQIGKYLVCNDRGCQVEAAKAAKEDVDNVQHSQSTFGPMPLHVLPQQV